MFRLGYTQLPKQKVKVINIGPDPPHLFKKYIWGRTCEYVVPLSWRKKNVFWLFILLYI